LQGPDIPRAQPWQSSSTTFKVIVSCLALEPCKDLN
jgi:hypothetical protein